MFDFSHGAQIAAETDQDRAVAAAIEEVERVTGGKSAWRRRSSGGTGVREIAILGKAGTGKTHVLARITEALRKAGFADMIEAAETPGQSPSLGYAVASPTNKAAAVLRNRGVTATTIHRLLYVPVYAEDYEELAGWLRNPKGKPPSLEGQDPESMERIVATFRRTESMAAALAAVGLRSADFITGWTLRDSAITVGLIDEASMITEDMLRDLRKTFKVLIFFGDPAQLAPVGCTTMPALDTPSIRRFHLTAVHRQAAGNPILDIAHLIQDPMSSFRQVEAAITALAARDERVIVSPRACADRMRLSPLLVWRNDTRRRVVHAWRAANGLDPRRLAEGEPVMIAGLEPGSDPAVGRIVLEQAGLVKGATATFVGPGRKPGHVRLALHDGPDRIVHVGAVVEFETDRKGSREIGEAARFGPILSPCPATTIHKSQGCQWPVVQVFGPDLAAAAASGREEAGAPLWRRLAYVAVTRAQEKLIWVTTSRISRPATPLAQGRGTAVEAA